MTTSDVVFVTCNDLHLTDVTPVSRTDVYIDEVFGLMDQMALLAVRQRASAILIAGDIFHHKAKVSIPTLIRVVNWCRRLQLAGVEVLSIPGNHDLLHNRYESLPSQPLGLLYELGAMVNVSARRGATPKVYGFGEPQVCVAGTPFPDAFDLACWEGVHREMYTSMRRVVLGHCFAAPVGGDYFGEPVHAYGDLYATCPADVYVFGHDHRDGGIMKLDRNGNPDDPAYFINLGAIARGSIAHDDIARTICCGLVRVGATVKVQRVKLNAVPAADIFDLDLKAKRDVEQAQIDQFVTHLTDTLASLGSNTSVEDHMTALSLPHEVRARMVQYLADVES